MDITSLDSTYKMNEIKVFRDRIICVCVFARARVCVSALSQKVTSTLTSAFKCNIKTPEVESEGISQLFCQSRRAPFLPTFLIQTVHYNQGLANVFEGACPHSLQIAKQLFLVSMGISKCKIKFWSST